MRACVHLSIHRSVERGAGDGAADPRGGGWASGFEAGERDELGAVRLDGDMGMGVMGLGGGGAA